MYFVAYLLQEHYHDKLAFQVACMVQALPALVALALVFVLPESPKWLASKSKWEKAAQSLARVKTITVSATLTKTNKQIVTNAYTEDHKIHFSTFTDLFGLHWRRTAAGLVVQFFCQMTGVIPLLNLFSFVCDACGLDGSMKTLVISCAYIVLGLFTIMPLLLLDRSRRIDLMAYGLFCTAIVYITLSAISAVHSVGVSTDLVNWVLQDVPAATSLSLYLFLFSVYSSTMTSVSWLYVGEIYPDEARAKGTAACMCVSHIITTTLTLVYPIILPRVKYWMFMILGSISLLGSICLLYLPETKYLYKNDSRPADVQPEKQQPVFKRISEETEPISEETKIAEYTKIGQPAYEYTDPSLIKTNSASDGSVVKMKEIPETTIDEVLDIYRPTSEISAKTQLNLFATDEWSEYRKASSPTPGASPVTGYSQYQTVSGAVSPQASQPASQSESSGSKTQSSSFFRSDSTEKAPAFHFKKSRNMLHG